MHSSFWASTCKSKSAPSANASIKRTSGLAGIVAAVNEGRMTFQRILTYTLNSMIKKIAMALFLVVGLVMTGHAVLTPMLLVILMVVGDFIAMSLTTDNVAPSASPNVWRIRNITIAGITLGLCQLVFSTAILSIGVFVLHLSMNALQTLAFITVAFGGQASTYAIRERLHLWSLPPSHLLVLSSSCDALICGMLAVFGFLVTPLPWTLVGGIFVAAVVFAVVLDVIKLPLFRRLQLS
jgi:H+-transporting ATPase